MVLTLRAYNPISKFSESSPGGFEAVPAGQSAIFFKIRFLTRLDEIVIDFDELIDLTSYSDSLGIGAASGNWSLKMRNHSHNDEVLRKLHPGMVAEIYCCRNDNPIDGVHRSPSTIERIDTTPELPITIVSSNFAPMGTIASLGGAAPANAAQWEQAIVNACLQNGVRDRNQIAYILATAKHESGNYNYLEEIASGANYEGNAQLGNTQSGDGVRFKGRGLVQVTGRRNYQLWSDRLNQDFINNPELMESPSIALTTLVVGMRDGVYTGRSLGDYISGSRVDFQNARRVVNGTDRASKIAGYAEDYLSRVDSLIGGASALPSTDAIAPTTASTPPPAQATEAYGDPIDPVEDYYLDKCPYLLLRGIVTKNGRGASPNETDLTVQGESFGKIYKDCFVLTDLNAPESASQSLEVRQATQAPYGVQIVWYRLLKEWVEHFWGSRTGWEARTRVIPFPPNYLTRINSEGTVWSNLQYLSINGFFHLFCDHTGALCWEKLPWSSKDKSLIDGRNWEDLQLLDLPSWKIRRWSDSIDESEVNNFIRCVPTQQGLSGSQEMAAMPALVYNIGSIRQYGGPHKRELQFPVGTGSDQYYTSSTRREQQATTNSFTALTALEAVRWYDRPVQRASLSVMGEAAWRPCLRVKVAETWSNPEAKVGEFLISSRSHQIDFQRGSWTTNLEVVRDRRTRYLRIGDEGVEVVTDNISRLREQVEEPQRTEGDRLNVPAIRENRGTINDLAGAGSIGGVSNAGGGLLARAAVDFNRGTLAGAGDRISRGLANTLQETVSNEPEIPPAKPDILLPLAPDHYFFFDRFSGRIVDIGSDPIAWAEKEVIPRLGEESSFSVLPPVSAQGGNPFLASGAIAGGAKNQQILQALSQMGDFSSAAGPGGGNVACVWAINRILDKAGIAVPWGGSENVDVAERALRNGGGTAIDISQAQPGDIVIWGPPHDGRHIGLVTQAGNPPQVISNSSSRARFSWRGDNTSVQQSYGSSATSRFYRMN